VDSERDVGDQRQTPAGCTIIVDSTSDRAEHERVKSVVVVALVLTTQIASAQPGATDPLDEPPPGQPMYARPYVPPYAQPAPELLSRGTALWWSAGGTAASYGLLFLADQMSRDGSSDGSSSIGLIGGLGIFVAPSFGHWYAGKYLTRGLGLRLGSVAVAATGFMIAIGCSGIGWDSYDDEPERNCDAQNAIGIGLVIVAGAMFVGGTIDDIVQAPRRVDRINAQRSGVQVYGVLPTADHDRVGLAVAGAF